MHDARAEEMMLNEAEEARYEAKHGLTARVPGGVLEFTPLPEGGYVAERDGYRHTIEFAGGMASLWIDDTREGVRSVASASDYQMRMTPLMIAAESYHAWLNGQKSGMVNADRRRIDGLLSALRDAYEIATECAHDCQSGHERAELLVKLEWAAEVLSREGRKS